MLDDYKSLPFIAGISILFLIPLSIASFTYVSLTEDSGNANSSTTSGEPQTAGRSKNSATGLEEENNFRVVPIPPSNSQAGSGNFDSDSGIPIGKYSNPPTNIPAGKGITSTTTNRGIDDSDSSIDRNRAIQHSFDNDDNSTPDYSAPSSSNNYQMPERNSLVAPLEDDSFLEPPESDRDSEPATIPTEPLTQPF